MGSVARRSGPAGPRGGRFGSDGMRQTGAGIAGIPLRGGPGINRRTVDAKGAASQGLEHAITIRRCDSEADFGQSSYSPICSSHPTSIYGNADDPDGIGPTSAVLVYTYVLNDGTTRTARKRMDGNNDGRGYYSVQIQAGADWDLNRSSFTFFIETTDRYGGTSRGGEGKTQATDC